jgi:hypothetical protein
MVLGVPDINSLHPRKPVGVIACVSLTDSAELNRTLVAAHAEGIFALEINGLVDDYVVLSRQKGLLSFGSPVLATTGGPAVPNGTPEEKQRRTPFS